MTAEAIARLRAARPLHDSYDGVVVSDLDLRALLDAHAALETAHTEALDALDELEAGPNLSNADTRGDRQVARNQWLLVMRTKARAVLAKAGRR